MKYFKSYFVIQLKRIKKLLPGIALMILALGVLLGTGAYAVIKDGSYMADQKRYTLGYVGEADNSLLRSGIFLLENEDSSRDMVELKQYDAEEDAKKALRKGDISAYILITDEFMGQIDSLSNGSKLQYYATSGQKGITSVMMDEIAAVAGNVIVYTEKGILSLDQVMEDKEFSDQERILQMTDFFNEYVKAIMARDSMVQIQTVGMSDGLSTPAYYFTTLTLFLLMMIPFCGIWIFLGERDAVARFMAAKGLGPTPQVLAEMLAFYLLNLFGLILVTALLALSESIFKYNLGELIKQEGLSVYMLPLIFLLPCLVFSTMGFFLLDAIQGVVNKVLVTFIIDIFMAYVSGFFYPRVFFPKAVQFGSNFLPSGAALTMLANKQMGARVFEPSFMLWAYSIIFILMTILVRKARVKY
ncbi:ABC-2 type transport system permease protein [Pseudobutyrivibrio sp. YE44]|uniref:ABC transporter permease n=1 Tax=Pseudobutyrivibrio sp. YE44 TaxID=1520802 RepID=UPI00087E3F5C|nr:ABC transporter permease [Pseudobutyrivibrio sp. YE44]SDB56595.1 ABC-2 type transport system permease protein [Pseudobutyrivibrio sp. YE44]